MLDNDKGGIPGKIPEFGAIIMTNNARKRESFDRKLFGLPSSLASFVKQIKSGMFLFLFEFERRELYGVYKACSDGAMDIVPRAFNSSGKRFPAQVRFNEYWRCSPLLECEFRDAIRDNYRSAKKFMFGLSEYQVHRLLSLFRSRKLKDQPPFECLSYGQLESTIGQNIDRAGSATLCHKYSSSDNLAEEHSAGHVTLRSGEFMRVSSNKVRYSGSGRKFISQAVREDDFEVENVQVPVVWNDHLEDMSGRARRFSGNGIFSAGDTMGYSPNLHRDLGLPDGGKVAQRHLYSGGSGFMARDRNSQSAWSDAGHTDSYYKPGISSSGVSTSIYPNKSITEVDITICDQLKPRGYHTIERRVSNINHAISQADPIFLRSPPGDANAWSDFGPANPYHCPRLSRSGVDPSVYPDKSITEPESLVSDQLKPTRYHSFEQQFSQINHAITQAAPISSSHLPCVADVPTMDYNSKDTADFNYSSDVELDCAPRLDVPTDFANEKPLSRQHSYEHSRPLSGIPKLLDMYTNNGKEIISDDEICTPQNHFRYSSSAVTQLGSGFSGTEDGDQTFFSFKSGNSMPFEYPIDSRGGFDYISSSDLENEALYNDNAMTIHDQGCLQIFDHVEVLRNPYNNKNSSPLHADESNLNSERIYSVNHKTRSTVFSRLALSPDVDVHKSFRCRIGNGNNMDACTGETITTFPHSRKQLKTTPTEQCTDEELRIDGKCKSFNQNWKRDKLERVSKPSEVYHGHVEERNRHHNIRREPFMDFKEALNNTKTNALRADREIGNQPMKAAPFIDFKCRRKLHNAHDVTENKDCERSKVLLGGQHKKRKLLRPKFDNEASDVRGISGDSSSNMLLSLQGSCCKNDSLGNDCERSNIKVSGQHKRRKIVWPKFNIESSDDRGICGETSCKILQEGSVGNDTPCKDYETSRVLLTRQHRRKLKRPTFGKNETSNDRGTIAGTANILLLSSQKGFLENETSARFQGFIETEVNGNIDCKHGCTDKNIDDGEPISSSAVTNNTVEEPSTDGPVVPNDILSSTGEGVIKVSKIDGFQDVPSSFITKDEKQEVSESKDTVCMMVTQTQSCGTDRCNVVKDSIHEEHIKNAANNTPHIESNNKKGSNDFSIEHVENCDEVLADCCRTDNKSRTNSSCHLTLESDAKILQACADGEDEELLQLSLNTGSMKKRTSNQILQSLRPSEKQAPSDKSEGLLQLSLGRQCVTSFDAANSSNMQE